MISAFRDIQHSEVFLRKGFTTFPLLSAEDVQSVMEIYEKANSGGDKLAQPQFYGVNYSLGTLTGAENKRIMEPVAALLHERLPAYFTDYELVGCVFITKPAHTATTFVYHQDWSYTDESQYAFATCWIPLCDTDTHNGGMSVIEGSHQFFESYRSDSLDSARIPFEKIPEQLRTNISQQKGNCLAFHQAAYHGSYPNHSDRSRVTLAVVVKPRQAPIVHYVREGDAIKAYEMRTSAFDQMLEQIPMGKIPQEAICISQINHIPVKPTAADLVATWRSHQPSHRLLRDQALHEQYIRDGYIRIRDVVSASIISQLRELYHAHFHTPDRMYVTHHDVKDHVSNKAMSDKIFDLLGEATSALFSGHQRLLSHFAAKGKGDNGKFNFHQDWSIVEEEIYAVAHCWIPLQDTDEHNGTLAVLPRSHLLFHNYRSGSAPIRFTPIESYQAGALHIPAAAGDMILYHPALYHGSGVNHSGAERLAVVAAIAHDQAERVYYHQEGGEVYQYELVNSDLFGRLDDLAQGGLPVGTKKGRVPHHVLDVSDAEVQDQLRSHLTKIKTGKDAII